MFSLWRDFRYSLRTLKRSPLTSLVILGVLAIGIAANVAMFSGFEAWVLRPLAFHQPEQLIFIYQTQPRQGNSQLSVSDPTTLDLQRELRSAQDVGAFRRVRFNILSDESPRRVQATAVSANLFPLLGVAPDLGRNFTAQEDAAGGVSAVALISRNIWRDNFAEDDAVLKQSLRIDGRPHRVVGVMPEGFAFPEWAEVWVPLKLDSRASRSNRSLNVIGRLRPERTLVEAGQELARISNDLERSHTQDMESFQLQAMSLRESFVPPVIDTAMLATMGAALFVLLIICTNVASLLMAQTTTRSSELALLSALGAGRLSLARRMMIESVLLALAGGLVGTFLGLWSVEWMISWVPVSPPYLFAFRFDFRAVVFTVGLSVLTGIACGLAPVWRNSGLDLIEALKGGSGRTSSARGGRLRQLLVAGQFAASLLLALGALLMVRSYLNQQRLEPGYSSDGLFVTDILLSSEAYAEGAVRVDFAERALDGLRRIPGVSSAGLADFLPISPRGNQVVSIVAEGRPRQPGEERFLTLHAVSSDYLSTLQLPLIAGRSFTQSEAREGADVVILSAGVVARLWEDGLGLGRQVRIGDSPQWRTVVGVTADIDPGHRMVSFARIPEIQAHVPYGGVRDRRIALVVRSDQPLSALAPLIRRELQILDSSLPVPEVLAMEQVVDQVQWVARVLYPSLDPLRVSGTPDLSTRDLRSRSRLGRTAAP